ncbi:MAG: hypothetical protein ACK4K7_02940 [Allosphingosinicella sp.]|uniref:hypothetical protein n=1 Tax=Allosphingosinicella sp. TaxID=2823234 RepID=UPI0039647385
MNGLKVLAAAVAFFCSPALAQDPEIRTLQVQSYFGATDDWPLDPSTSLIDIQRMRDSAYGFCLVEKGGSPDCLYEQDHSLFEYVRSFGLVRIFRGQSSPTFAFAAAHKSDPSAFDLVRSYCESIYIDHGSRDARILGPCMMAGLGGDFFGIVPVP